MIVQFKEEFLEVLKEYGTGIRITTAFVDGSYKKFESLWNGETLSFTLKECERLQGPIIVYYSDYNDNKIGKAFTLGTYTAESCPDRESSYIKGEVEVREDGKYIDGIRYEGEGISNHGVYLVTKSVRDGNLILVGSAIEEEGCDEDIILTSTNYFNVHFPVDIIKANIIETCSDSTIQFLENPCQIEGCNIFKCDSEIPTRESYEKHYRRQVLSKNTTPTYLDERGEKVQTSTLYKHYKSLSIQAIDVPYADNTYYVGNSKSVTISGSCVYDLYKVENGSYTLIKEDNVEGIDAATLECILGDEKSYKITDKVISFNISTVTEKSSFRGYIKFKDEIGGGEVRTIVSNTITFITYLGWSVEYSSNLKEESTGNIVFLFDTGVGSKGLLRDNKITIYSDADVPVESVRVLGDVSDFFNFDIKKDTQGISEQYKYTVDISTRRATEVNGKWFPIGPSGNSELLPCVLEIQGSSDKVTFYCVQRAKYPLKVFGNPIISGYGAKMTFDLTLLGQEIGDGYSGWDYEIEGRDTAVNLYSGKKVGDSFNIITRKNPSAKPDKVKFFRVGPSGEVLKDSWKDVMYCFDDNSTTLEVIVDGESLGENPYFYNNHDLFVFKNGDTTPQYFDCPENPGEIKPNNYFEFKWISGKIRITPKEVPSTSLEWYPREEKKDVPVMYTIGPYEFYCVVAPNLDDTIKFLDSTNNVVESLHYRNTERSKEVSLISTASSKEFNYWRVVGLDSRAVIFYNQYTNGYGVPFDSSITLESQYQVPNSRDIEFEPLVVQRVASRYTTVFDYLNDWRNQLVVDSIATLPLSMVGKNPSDILEIQVYNPDGSLKKLQDDEFLELDYIGLYKLFIKSSTTYRISIKGVERGKQYFYFFNTLTDTVREGVLSIDKGSFDVISGEEVCFAFYGGEPGNFETASQILGTYIQIEDLASGETVNIKLRRTYPDNNLKKVIPLGTDIYLKNNETEFDILFSSNVETDKGIPTFSNSLYSMKGTVTRKLNTSEIWIRGYEEHIYEYSSSLRAPSHYPISAVDTLSIENPGRYNGEVLEYNIFKFPEDPYLTTDKRLIELPYRAGSSCDVRVDVRSDARYRVFYAPKGEKPMELLPRRDMSYGYQDEFIHIYKNSDDDPWNIEEITGEDYGDDTTEVDIQYGTLVFRSYIDKNEFIEGRTFSQEQVDEFVPGVMKGIPVVRLCKKNSVSTIFGSNIDISRLGETRQYECNLTGSGVLNLEKSLSEQPHLKRLEYDEISKTLSVTFKSRLERAGYVTGIPKNQATTIKETFTGRKESGFYVWEGEDRVYFNDLFQEPWEVGIRASGNLTITGNYSSGIVFLGENNLSPTTLDYNNNSIVISIVSVDLTTGTLTDEPKKCKVEVTGPGASYVMMGYIEQSSSKFGYSTTISLPLNNSSTTTEGPYVVKISDEYGNTIQKTYYKNPKSSFQVFLAQNVTENLWNPVGETAFTTTGRSLHPTNLYIVTDAPPEISRSYSLDPRITTAVGSGAYATATITVSSTYNIINGVTPLYAYRVEEITNKISYYYDYNSYNLAKLNGFGHIPYDTNIQIRMYCNGSYSYSNTIRAHNGYCEARLMGPYRVHHVEDTYSADFEAQDIIDETSKYNVGSYFVSNSRGEKSYYSIDNDIYVVYQDRDPKRFNIPLNGYYAGFKLVITRKEYVFSGGTWKLSEKTIHTLRSGDRKSAVLIAPHLNMPIIREDGQGDTVPSYVSSANPLGTIYADGSSAGNGSVTVKSSGYEFGFVFTMSPIDFIVSSDKYSCQRTFTISSEGIDDTIDFTINFELYL